VLSGRDLQYFKDDKAREAKGRIDLEGAKLVVKPLPKGDIIDKIRGESKPPTSHSWSIQIPTRTYNVCANTEDEMKTWVFALAATGMAVEDGADGKLNRQLKEKAAQANVMLAMPGTGARARDDAAAAAAAAAASAAAAHHPSPLRRAQCKARAGGTGAPPSRARRALRCTLRCRRPALGC